MGWKTIITLIFGLFLISLMIFYFIPFNTINFSTNTGNYNFSVIQGNSTMQFYPNMRFSSQEISYRIFDCPLQKEDDMEFAFDIMENITPLRFYPVVNNEEISITCEEILRVDKDFFIAGEGGPVNITVSGQFNVIMNGEILLIKESDCPRPNIALHELFHVLGFGHSSNQGNIMYNITNCDQTIGQDMIQLIETLYSVPSYPDLSLENVSAVMTGRFLSVNMIIMNRGLNNAGASKVYIYVDNTFLKELDLIPLETGRGRIISISNIFVTQLNINELDFIISSDFKEITKDNNEKKLKVEK